jgi:ATP-dependent helicase/DNAse subunit B
MGRSQAAVLALFDGALGDAACALPEHPVPLREFWRAVKSILRLTPLRVEDRRRNVVHVLGAHEARQWQLPAVFVCGLVEKQFPRFHTQDPFLLEAARAQLKQEGIRLRTAADFEVEERFLFDSAVTRATEMLTLSYPRCDARGQPNLPSLFLESVSAAASPPQAVRPKPGRQGGAVRPAEAISAADLLEALAARHKAFRPTALESYLQCPFQFFGQRTLRLEKAPARPEERFNFLTEGNIVHAVLAELYAEPRALEEIFEHVFRRICGQERVPAGYRTEACRERLLSDLRDFLADNFWPHGFEKRTEQGFLYPLGSAVEIRGRMDRLDVTPDGRAFVIDYKYSGAQNTKKRLDEETRLQPQLYLLALERVFGLRAAGMFYCGLRGGVKWAGWSEDPSVAGGAFPPGWLEQAVETTLRITQEIRAGRVAPRPADPDQCRRCDYRDVCRFQAAPAGLAEGA